MAAFWRVMPPREGMQGRRDWRRRCVPLALHGDGISVANVRGKASKTAETLSWTSLLASTATRLSTFLIWFAFSHLTKKDGFGTTWGSFWTKMCRSLTALYEGVWPATDMNDVVDPRGGRPLAGGWWAIIYVCRGDLEWMASHFALARTTSRSPCALCRCTNLGIVGEEYPWTDCNNPPRWDETRYTDEAAWEKSMSLEWVNERPNPRIKPGHSARLGWMVFQKRGIQSNMILCCGKDPWPFLL